MRLIFLLLPLFLFAQEKGYIDMHGGKKQQLYDKSSHFSNFNSQSDNTILKSKKTSKQQIKTQQRKNVDIKRGSK